MNLILKFVLIVLLSHLFAFGQQDYSLKKQDNDVLLLSSGFVFRVDSLINTVRVAPEAPREERAILRQKLKYPMIVMGVSLVGAFYYQKKANKAYERYQEYYFFPQKSSVFRDEVEKFDNISLGFYLTFEVSVFWTFYELIRLE